ncbi:flagellar biosynthesis protein FlhB [Brevirhabdus pacifica]|uniref:Flagellar biosynthesis protein FlhB n=1 Tax=Brevirhabdus pacifica TaxID=1267768 RepID=A0A1U7DH27_9RHOB|nr:flagellar type III secretion system protein FlhB [Brevirhabdus pacifica]APX89193.1 flagellar biosynthesis protein FlhB [Brevirhabdus pacifica]OWU76756.1 flagellar biosynthesis protein [Loktanella sp. 22II-4b]PJJ86205.1 flagellar biosynthetic protein FlhB [Brevirhabdus pacifica]
MANDEDKSSKTEEPTEQKLRKARKKGDVPSSRETGNMMVVFSLFVLVTFLLPAALPKLSDALGEIFAGAGQIEVGTGRSGLRDLGGVLWSLATGLGVILGPAMLLMVLAAMFGVLIQGETVVSAERIKPKFNKLNPWSGFKKLFSPDSLVEFLKNVTKVLVVATITVFVARNAVTGIWEAEGFLPEQILSYISRYAAILLIGASVFLVPVAIGDILWKRFQWMKKQRMSLKEIKDEVKDSEGDPQMRGRRAEIRRERARQRIAVAVPTATVVLTNPTHYAVALRYQPGVDHAPVCVAKGMDAVALQIRKLAREAEVPLVENRPLARALHAVVELDQPVPVEHWQAVAEIIGYVMDLKRNIRRKPPSGSALRED